jgi:hypothetical protein
MRLLIPVLILSASTANASPIKADRTGRLEYSKLLQSLKEDGPIVLFDSPYTEAQMVARCGVESGFAATIDIPCDRMLDYYEDGLRTWVVLTYEGLLKLEGCRVQFDATAYSSEGLDDSTMVSLVVGKSESECSENESGIITLTSQLYPTPERYSVEAVPEPASIVLFLTGLLYAYRNKKRQT